jgi:hypothetical protein
MAAKEVAVKKYVVRLSAGERAQLDDLTHKGKCSAQLLTKARMRPPVPQVFSIMPLLANSTVAKGEHVLAREGPALFHGG